MNFKTRLTLLFVGLFVVVLTAILSFIYILYAEFRREEFFERLREKSFTTAKLLTEVKGMDLEVLKIIDQNSINKLYDEKILIFDSTNRLIYSSLDDEKIPYSPSLIDQIRTRADKYYVDDDGDEVVGVHYKDQGHDYVILASAYDTYGISKVENLKTLVVIALVLGAALIAVAAYFYIRQVFRPIDDLNKSIQTITENNLHEFIRVHKNRDELDKLAVNYNQMLARLFKAFESQRSFVRHAAHELKTPLAIIRTKLERLEDLTAGRAEVGTILTSLSDDVDGQAALVESLLLMQRLQSQVPINTGPVRIDELLDESARELHAVYPQQVVQIDIDASVEAEEQLTVIGNALLLKICFRNLIANAALYASIPTLTIDLAKIPEGLRLRFSNPGEEAIPEGLIFEPFYRQPHEQEKPGHGLGLSIVRQITDLTHGAIAYQYVNGQHIFTLIFTHI
ncbi:HAMP domain-containing protein [Fulvivirgaceae bacterium PWU5]|uniref:histidine kinase n=1 Tax=Dawidia cretensis TaxID=2782350 RepID=A0AAP2DUD2_9BACT|nr:HAMP domain-containing sensor histidine kinase [Dawidia cretensis]MBT1707581.1 HAMP domain-containing protein [Dawidia cretensis]